MAGVYGGNLIEALSIFHPIQQSKRGHGRICMVPSVLVSVRWRISKWGLEARSGEGTQLRSGELTKTESSQLAPRY
jgi:hypothetical protein